MKLNAVTLAPTRVPSDLTPTAVGGTTGRDAPTERPWKANPFTGGVLNSILVFPTKL